LVRAIRLAELQASTGDKYFYDPVAGQVHIKLTPMPDRDLGDGVRELGLALIGSTVYIVPHHRRRLTHPMWSLKGQRIALALSYWPMDPA
jgi:hypothetical protein